MNTVITAAAPNSSPMMSSKEIAELTGKAHKNVIRDIESMIAEIEKDGSNLSHQAKSTGYTVERDNRGYVKIIHLDHSHTITLITGYDAKQRKKVVDRWLELETMPNSISKPIDRITVLRKAIALHGSALAFNKRQGMDLTQARLKAVATVKEQMGIDLTEELGWQAQPLAVQERTVNATEIGREIGLKNTEVNQLLAEQGFCTGLRDLKGRRVWKPTAKGLKFGRYEDKTKAHSSGTVQPWVWFPSIIEELRPFARTPAQTA
ncbi:Rha family transcriptional regulator [Acetobacter sp. P1H12_c]|uniref:Rha family transcriptional regulator n=1 Tax=Acetobacter sp. P1H12_c TaxID=2762621 RepID=UPI001C042841|nr:Rha family transcriptional regulator [Acetobacter sp. P1H12_c]